MHTRAARLPRGTGPIFETNLATTQRAGGLAAANPANRLQLGRLLQCAARSRPAKVQISAAFGWDPEKAAAGGVLPGRGPSQCAVWPLGDAP